MSDQPASMRRVFDIEDDDKPAKRVVCFDPDDPEVIERVAQCIYECEFSYPVWAAAGYSMQTRRRDRARAVLSALKASG